MSLPATSEPGINLPLKIADIEKCIPHRHPFLLIDRITELVLNEKVVAIRCISASDPILTGHFPGNPVVPGVLIIEAMAQAAGVLGQLSSGGSHESFLLTDVGKARFRRLVVPGDELVLNVKVQKARKGFFWFEGEAMVEDELASEVQFSARMV